MEEQEKDSQDEQQRDVWTGGPDWTNIFSLWNLFMVVLIVFLIYIFLNKVLPVIKKSIH